MDVTFKPPAFYPILDTAVLAGRGWAIRDAAEALLEAGVRILQYRHKEKWTQAEYDEAAEIKSLCDTAGVLFVLNDHADYAQLLGTALHVGQDDLPPVAARRVTPDNVMGFSTHNRQQLVRGDEEPVQYLSLGPIFATESKLKPDPVIGIERLRALRPLTKKPLVAIGGIKLETASDVLAARADSVAIIAGILPDSPKRAALKKRATEWLKATA
ncbi:MAG: thiamine phosphate synthase [Acidobacteriaceae bacterium]|nr:thiamine phosphate synthase [Acidobacteriaceae bacterium]